MDELGGAAAGARLYERAVVFTAEAQPANLLLRQLLAQSHLQRDDLGGTDMQSEKKFGVKTSGRNLGRVSLANRPRVPETTHTAPMA